MPSLPLEDDGPTMSGLPEDRSDELPPDGDDTTSAAAGPPASRDEPAENDEEDRTVQQKVDPPPAARRPDPAPPTLAASPSRSVIARPSPADLPQPSSKVPSTQPSTQPAAMTPPRPAAGSTTEATERASLDGDEDDELEEIDPDEDAIEDSITATAPRMNAANLLQAAHAAIAAQPPGSQGHGLPMVIPGSVQIRTVEHDDLAEETEVRTRPGHIPLSIPATLRASTAGTPSQQASPSPRPAAGRPPSISPPTEVPFDFDGENDDDGVTTEGPAPRIGSVPDLGAMTLASVGLAPPTIAESADEPPTRPGVEGVVDEPPTRPGLPEPPTRPGLGGPEEPETSKRVVPKDTYANEDDDADEKTTTNNQATSDFADSVTTQGPSSLLDGTLDDGTDGTTKVKRTPAQAGPSSPADDEAESITTQAPGNLTNILRVIASGSSPELETDSGVVKPLEPIEPDEDDAPENRTAVMANAPLKRVIAELTSASALPALRPTGGPLTHGPQASAAHRLEPSSESGLRVARASGVGERASLGALGVADGRPSGIIANAMASDGSVSAPIDLRAHGADMQFPSGQPSLHDVDLGKGPRYGLLVAIVAVVSIIVPVTLFLALRKDPDAAVVVLPSEPVSELQTSGPPRAKAPRNKNGTFALPSPSASASAVPSGSASAKNNVGPIRGGGPLHR